MPIDVRVNRRPFRIPPFNRPGFNPVGGFCRQTGVFFSSPQTAKLKLDLQVNRLWEDYRKFCALQGAKTPAELPHPENLEFKLSTLIENEAWRLIEKRREINIGSTFFLSTSVMILALRGIFGTSLPFSPEPFFGVGVIVGLSLFFLRWHRNPEEKFVVNLLNPKGRFEKDARRLFETYVDTVKKFRDISEAGTTDNESLTAYLTLKKAILERILAATLTTLQLNDPTLASATPDKPQAQRILTLWNTHLGCLLRRAHREFDLKSA